jgi:hypothetical protein
MAASFCTSCGSSLDAAGICPRRCEAGALPVPPYETNPAAEPGAARYGGAAAASVVPPYAAAPLTRFSGMWNWGGFLLCPFWLMNHGALGLGIGYLVLSLIPGLNIGALGMAIYFGIKGNDWAVQHRQFADEYQFVAVQNAWRNWGFVVALIGVVLGIIGAVLLGLLGLLTGVHSH